MRLPQRYADPQMKIDYHVIAHADIDNAIRSTFAEKLGKQNKVGGNLAKKADRCKLVCLVNVDGTAVAIGGIKEKTQSDFGRGKADIPELASEFQWELGYLYTEPEHQGRGIGSNVARLLIESYGKGHLMASTEVTANPGMVRILERHGFRLFGKPWKSGIHSNYLGLFLRFE